jgi:hypothetical protein
MNAFSSHLSLLSDDAIADGDFVTSALGMELLFEQKAFDAFTPCDAFVDATGIVGCDVRTPKPVDATGRDDASGGDCDAATRDAAPRPGIVNRVVDTR